MEKQLTDGENNFPVYPWTENWYYWKITKKRNIKHQENKQSSQNQAVNLSKETQRNEIQIANTHFENVKSLTVKGMLTKIALSFYLSHYRTTIIKKSNDNQDWRKCVKRALTHCWWECTLVYPLWKSTWSRNVTIWDIAFQLLGIYPKDSTAEMAAHP